MHWLTLFCVWDEFVVVKKKGMGVEGSADVELVWFLYKPYVKEILRHIHSSQTHTHTRAHTSTMLPSH